jgi:hypothetical protein
MLVYLAGVAGFVAGTSVILHLDEINASPVEKAVAGIIAAALWPIIALIVIALAVAAVAVEIYNKVKGNEQDGI